MRDPSATIRHTGSPPRGRREAHMTRHNWCVRIVGGLVSALLLVSLGAGCSGGSNGADTAGGEDVVFIPEAPNLTDAQRESLGRQVAQGAVGALALFGRMEDALAELGNLVAALQEATPGQTDEFDQGDKHYVLTFNADLSGTATATQGDFTQTFTWQPFSPLAVPLQLHFAYTDTDNLAISEALLSITYAPGTYTGVVTATVTAPAELLQIGAAPVDLRVDLQGPSDPHTGEIQPPTHAELTATFTSGETFHLTVDDLAGVRHLRIDLTFTDVQSATLEGDLTDQGGRLNLTTNLGFTGYLDLGPPEAGFAATGRLRDQRGSLLADLTVTQEALGIVWWDGRRESIPLIPSE